jgi:hypothetical protein
VTRTDPPVLSAIRVASGQHRGVRQIALGRADPHVQPGRRAAQQVRVRHVAGAVAHEGERLPGERAHPTAVLRDREQVRQHLARVELVGQRVDHGHAGLARHLLEALLRVGPPDDRRDLSAQDARRVGDRLAHTDLGKVAVDDEREPAELGDTRRERDLRAQRRLVEDHRDDSGARERRADEPVVAEGERELEDLALLAGGQLVVTQEVAHHLSSPVRGRAAGLRGMP